MSGIGVRSARYIGGGMQWSEHVDSQQPLERLEQVALKLSSLVGRELL